LDFDYDLEDCDGYTICFDALMLNGGAANWDFGDPNTDTDFALDNPTPCYDYPEAGTYIVTLSEDLEACAGIPIQKMIVVPEILELTTTLDTLTYQGDTTLILPAQSNGVDTIQWCAADGTNIGQGDTLFYVPSGTTDVFAKVVSQFGCTDSVSQS